MPRRQGRRKILGHPGCTCFRPLQGELAEAPGWIALQLDELEALRLADRDGLRQEEAAGRMGVSRPTFTRIVGSARQKVARALCDGLELRISGGNVEIAADCPDCRRPTPEISCGRRCHGGSQEE